MAELRAGRAVQVLVTDFPRIKFNHSVLAFDYRAEDSDTVDFIVYDPKDPAAPGVVRFDPRDALSPRAALRRVGALLPRVPPVLLAVLLDPAPFRSSPGDGERGPSPRGSGRRLTRLSRVC
jgi:hypothetical protein